MGDSANQSDFSRVNNTRRSDTPSSQAEKTSSQSFRSYIGRFAPSPTGPLHFGSLIAATASYLCARQQNGQWLLRMEDVDTLRERKGASQAIIETLENYGFQWDGDIRFQSQHNDDYEKALATLEGSIFACTCTRKFLLENASSGKYGYIYPGYCRDSHKMAEKGGGVLRARSDRDIRSHKQHYSLRVRSDNKNCNSSLAFVELCQKQSFTQDIESEVGDFILKRSDGLFAYQLAVVVDDECQGVTDIVRGADLFDNTPRQNYLQCLLGYKQPRYLHFPVAVDINGNKLSKHNLAPEISTTKKRATLIEALSFLGQKPPTINNFSSMGDLWQWAVQNWSIDDIPKTLQAIDRSYDK